MDPHQERGRPVRRSEAGEGVQGGGECQVRVKNGVRKFKAADLSLSVTATDSSGNSASQQAAPGASSVARLLSAFEGTMFEERASRLEKKLRKLERLLEKWLDKWMKKHSGR